MLPDFSDVYREFISDDGEMMPPVSLQIPANQTWAVDIDGLLMSMLQFGVDGEPCVLSVLFPMPLGAAQAKVRQRRFPARAGDWLTVGRKRDEVVGGSGERYSRFIAEVMPAAQLAGDAAT